MSRILWVSVETPDQAGQGGQRRQFHQIKSLIGRGHEITVLVPHSVQRSDSIGKLTTVLRPRISIRGYVIRRLVRRLQVQLLTPGWDAIVVSHHESWWMVPNRGFPPNTRILLDMHNVMSAWHSNAGRSEEARIAADEERIAVSAATAVSTCSPTELRRLLQVHPDASSKSFAAPLGVDPSEWPDEKFDRTIPVVALFGSWGWRPNSLGLAWFLGEVWPGVRTRVPSAVALVAGPDVAGSDVADTASWPAGARFVGRMDDLAAFVASATVVAVPVIEGVGASVKFAEALVSGAAVIATPDGASAVDDPPARISLDAGEWIEWIVERLENRLTEPAPAASRAIALRDLSWNSAVAPLDQWIRATPSAG